VTDDGCGRADHALDELDRICSEIGDCVTCRRLGLAVTAKIEAETRDGAGKILDQRCKAS
jgi:hypothetical protein